MAHGGQVEGRGGGRDRAGQCWIGLKEKAGESCPKCGQRPTSARPPLPAGSISHSSHTTVRPALPLPALRQHHPTTQPALPACSRPCLHGVDAGGGAGDGCGGLGGLHICGADAAKLKGHALVGARHVDAAGASAGDADAAKAAHQHGVAGAAGAEREGKRGGRGGWDRGGSVTKAGVPPAVQRWRLQRRCCSLCALQAARQAARTHPDICMPTLLATMLLMYSLPAPKAAVALNVSTSKPGATNTSAPAKKTMDGWSDGCRAQHSEIRMRMGGEEWGVEIRQRQAEGGR